MSALDDLKTRIDSAIYTNTEQNITGDGLQTVLDDMVDTMGVSVSQNSQTGHIDINVGNNEENVASLFDLDKVNAKLNGATVSINDFTKIEDKYINSSGSLVSASTFDCYILQNIGFKNLSVELSASSAMYAIAFYSTLEISADNLLESSVIGIQFATTLYKSDIPTECKLIVLSNYRGEIATPTPNVETIYGVKTILISNEYSENIFLDTVGNFRSVGNYIATDYIPIMGLLKCDVKAVMGNQYGGGICFYDDQFKFISSIYNETQTEVSEYTLDISGIPANAAYMRIQGMMDLGCYCNCVYNTDLYEYGIQLLLCKPRPIVAKLQSSQSVLTDLALNDTPDTRNGCNIGFTCKVTTMGLLRITRGTNLYNKGKIEIDSTNLYVFDPLTENDYETLPHGLTIADTLGVFIEVKQKPISGGDNYYRADISIVSKSGIFKAENIKWYGSHGNVTVNNVGGFGGSYSNALLTFGGSAFGKDVWLFGDSYTTFWGPYVFDYASNFLIDGWGGRGSVDAYTSLVNTLKLGKPKKVVWMLGMNDGDSENAVNTVWYSTYNKVKDLCNIYGIELILATIPNTPTILNTYKNAIIKNSGYSYIDIAECVGASNAESSWYSGLLASDNVHPTPAGSKVIANYILCHLPEIF